MKSFRRQADAARSNRPARHLTAFLPYLSLPMPAYHLRAFVRSGRVVAAILSILALCMPAGAASVEAWSQEVWRSALNGRAAELQAALQDAPLDSSEAVKHLRESLERFRQHSVEWATGRAEAHQKSLTEVGEKLDAGEAKFLEALNAAIMAQTLSDNWAADLQLPQIKRAIAEGDRVTAEARQTGQWLVAQEVLVRLRLMHEDQKATFSIFRRYDEELKEVSRRVGLIAQFAPHKLYDLGKFIAAKYYPDREVPEYKESPDNDWREQVADIDHVVLKDALEATAEAHIDRGGWEPLLSGGLEALRVLGSTEAISETLPSLGDPAAVAQWLAAIDAQKRYVAGRRETLERGDFTAVLGAVLEANLASINLPKEIIFQQFGDGAMNELERRYADEYSEIIWPSRYRRFKQQVDGSFTGVGILIRNDEKRSGIMVVNPIEGSPAHRGGVKAGDLISTVNGKSTAGWSLNRAVDEIMGPKNTPVMLGLEREGVEGLVDVTLLRATIPIRSVNGWWKKGLTDRGEPEWDWMIDPVSRIGYVRLTSFNDNSAADLRAALRQMDSKQAGGLNGLILDLRFNPGGLLSSAIEISNLFVGDGRIVSCEDRDGREVFAGEADRVYAKYQSKPLVVLVNEGSASASEIVAGCLQAHNAAVVVGARSFGKGSVQTVHPVGRGGKSQLKLTTQHYVLPPLPGEEKGRLVHKKPGAEDWGVNPDIAVAMTPDQLEKALELREKSDIVPETVVGNPPTNPVDRPDVRDLIAKGMDPQLETALVILQARVVKDAQTPAIAAGAKQE
jgi:carboxyl-terminal processing protease